MDADGEVVGCFGGILAVEVSGGYDVTAIGEHELKKTDMRWLFVDTIK